MARKKTPATVPAALAPFTPRKAIPMIHLSDVSEDRRAECVAEQIAAPEMRAYRTISLTEKGSGLDDCLDAPGMLSALKKLGQKINTGDLSHAESMLINQAVALESLSTRLLERGWNQTGLPQFEAFMRLALKAQAQSRLAIEAIATLKHGPAIFARQANVTNGGPLQVNNNAPPASGAEESKNAPSKLLEGDYDLDTGTPPTPSNGNSRLEAVGEINRTKNRRRKA
jgi:hypothetical protein